MAPQAAGLHNSQVSGPGWTESFPELSAISDPEWRTIARSALVTNLREGSTVYREGEICEYYVLVSQGSVGVQRSSVNGHVITLCHLHAGEACELSVSCLLSGRPYPAEAVTDTDSRIILIPEKLFHRALAETPRFRKFVFSSLGRGIEELVTLIEEVAFGHMDGRLARHLLSHGDDRVECTHQELAEELGSAREVISRLLKRFEQQRWVCLHRGYIEIVDREVLEKLARNIDR